MPCRWIFLLIHCVGGCLTAFEMALCVTPYFCIAAYVVHLDYK